MTGRFRRGDQSGMYGVAIYSSRRDSANPCRLPIRRVEMLERIAVSGSLRDGLDVGYRVLVDKVGERA